MTAKKNSKSKPAAKKVAELNEKQLQTAGGGRGGAVNVGKVLKGAGKALEYADMAANVIQTGQSFFKK